MKTYRKFRLLLIPAMAVILLIAVSCTSPRYGAGRKHAPKGCNCPSF